jgi:broad specificity phosphatase PhoE
VPVVLLVRHGQASFGAEDYDVLSDLGREQSRIAGEQVRRRSLRDPVVVTGTLRRQRDTAALALPEAPAQVDGRWDEYDHLDLLKRYAPPATAPPTSSREVQALLDAALRDWVEHGDAGGWPVFSGGARAALDDLVAGLPAGRDAVVVTSGGVVAALCAALLGGGAAAVVALNRTAVNAAITTVAVGRSGTSLLSWNEHAHLPREQVTYR